MKTALQTASSVTQLSSMDILLLPIGVQGVGEDPLYGEEFASIKQEINRLSDTDYPQIARLCRNILKNEAKDLRVAGYYLMAKVFNEGIIGLHEAVQLYLELLKRYGDACHPQREVAKAQAIAWLNNKKLTAFVNKMNVSSDEELQCVSSLKSMVEALNKEFVSLYSDKISRWTSLNSWIENNIQTVPTNTEEVDSEDRVSSRVIDSDTSEITSELVFTRSVERLLEYFANDGDLERMISVSRAIKWSAIDLPSNESGTTRITPPRETVISAAEISKESGADESQLYVLESYFMEAGCQYYLDLQMQEFNVARTLGKDSVAEIIESFMRLLIKRHPKLMYLKFSDGKPFANKLTQRWLKQLDMKQEIQTTACRDVNSTELSLEMSKITDHMNECGLAESIEKMSRLNAVDQSENFQVDLAKIDMCINAGREDMALLLAQKLEAQVERYRLAEWDKALALELWDKLLMIIQRVDKGIEGKEQKIDELKGKICATDIGFALGVF